MSPGIVPTGGSLFCKETSLPFMKKGKIKQNHIRTQIPNHGSKNFFSQLHNVAPLLFSNSPVPLRVTTSNGGEMDELGCSRMPPSLLPCLDILRLLQPSPASDDWLEGRDKKHCRVLLVPSLSP
ncbi:unnamed protein product [Linum trigynum]|uniref:Uncharacterized protein n=1 Tax=Linum trigynum TaxID=586398 RepID=A0AAV2EA35_9ROSI